MQGSKLEIFYFDLKQGVTQQQAVDNLATLLNILDEAALKIVVNTHATLSSGLTKDKAQRYFESFSDAGLHVEIRPCSIEKNGIPDAPPPCMDADDMTLSAFSAQNEHSQDQFTAIQFYGKGFEYFKIWIVNIFLTLVTLGIYSAWAKVRNKQYFYGNTQIDGSSFQYTAKPIAILKGRLIAVVFFILYSVLNNFNPILGAILFLVLMIFLPWIILQSLRFNARNSVFRNIRFDFTGKVKQAVPAFLLWPMLMPFTLGLILPFVWYKQSMFFINNSAFGTQNFKFNATVKDYYKIFFKALMIFFGGSILLALLVSMVMFSGVVSSSAISEWSGASSMMPFMMLPIILVLYTVVFAYIASALGNLYFNATGLKEHSFHSQLKTKNMAWLYFGNTLGIALTLGLFIPWAQVRIARYKIECLSLTVKGSLNAFINAEEEQVSALGEQVGEVFDMDVSVL